MELPLGVYVHDVAALRQASPSSWSWTPDSDVESRSGVQTGEDVLIVWSVDDQMKGRLFFGETTVQLPTDARVQAVLDEVGPYATQYELFDDPVTQLAHVGYSALWNHFITGQCELVLSDADFQRNVVNMAAAVVLAGFDRAP